MNTRLYGDKGTNTSDKKNTEGFSQALREGALLDHGKYRIERLLGQGGFGLTYLVTDLGLDKLRALKEFFPKDYCDRDEQTSQVSLGTTNTAELVERLKIKFIKEARNIANLDQHPGIVKIHTVFEENNTAYYVMDFIDGKSLSEIVKKEGPVPLDKALRYIRKVGEALQYVHSQNINHLDIKPANIMVRRRDDNPILIDFGLAKQYDDEGHQTSTTPTGISHGFAPFEQYHAGGVNEFSPRTDIYSLAATLYYIVSGVVPPHATELIEGGLTFPEGFPEFLIYPISQAMSSRRQDRPESVTAFLELLEQAQQSSQQAVVVADPVYTVDEDPEPVREIPVDNEASKKENKQREAQTELPKPEVAPTDGGKSSNKLIFLGAGLAIACGIILMLIIFNSKGDNTHAGDATADTAMAETGVPKTVTKMAFETPLGICMYAGPIDDEAKPHGHGVAKWDRGDAREYDGEWVHGVMEGHAKYEHASGDTFEGTFHDNQYKEGKYTMKEDGSYYIGTFKNGQTDKGQWYTKSGQPM